jgi:hypothetical protein
MSRFLPLLFVGAGFFAAIPWLRHQDDAFVLAFTAAVAVFLMGYALFLSNRIQRQGHYDEVQIAGGGFAAARGWVWGAMAAVALLLVPPVANGLIDLANTLGTGSPDASDRDAVRLALYFGSMFVVALQLIAIIVASVIWQRRMDRPMAPGQSL